MSHTVEIDLQGSKVSIETGKVAKQANGSVVVRSGDSVVLVTACSAEKPKPGAGFFPLTVDYREYMYAAGKFPGGFIKREGRPSEKEILTSRLIDRPVRPLFPEGFMCETQIIAMVLSADPEHDPGILAIIGAGAALAISRSGEDGDVLGLPRHVDGRVHRRLHRRRLGRELRRRADAADLRRHGRGAALEPHHAPPL